MKRPSGLTLLAGALLLLMPALAALQFRWVGQVSDAERERMERNLIIAAAQFQEGFDSQIRRAYFDLQIRSGTARERSWEQYADRYDNWLNNAAHPQLIRNIYLISASDDRQTVELHRWDPARRTFEPVPWPERLARWRLDFEEDLDAFNAGRQIPLRSRFTDDDGLLVGGMRPVNLNPAAGSRPQTIQPVFGFTVLELDLDYARDALLPELTSRHFTHATPDTYVLAVVAADDTRRVIYRSDPEAPVDVEHAAVTQGLFIDPRSGPPRAIVQPRPEVVESARAPEPNDADIARLARRNDDPARWRLFVQHQTGSLEAAVSGARSRNLALSFGVLMLLTLSIGLLTVTSRRAQRLAQQQMEFVASVSHELRTPVAVIKSAAENLSQGVVGSGERVKRYGQMIEGEARRLGEMVERVLQYAGIESGLGYGARAPLAPAEVVETAINTALTLVGPDAVDIHREIAEHLPPVVGDAAALRSVVQNLVANAVKYGGTDRWVGVRVETVREHGRSLVRITVSDHGPGIPADELPRIFDPFYRGADAMARQIHGNGLGLSLVKRIVAAHGGDVTVTTRAGAGSSFTISLPAAEPEASSSGVAREVRAAVHP
jgi:signal transduction histidine kinase